MPRRSEDVDDPDAITAAPDDTVDDHDAIIAAPDDNNKTAGSSGFPSEDFSGFPSGDFSGFPSGDFSGFPSRDFSGFQSDIDARPKRQRNPLTNLQETASRLQPATSKRISRPPGASEETAPPPAPEERNIHPLDRTILNIDTHKPAPGKYNILA